VLKCAIVSPDKAEFDAKLAELTTPEAKASVEVIAGECIRLQYANWSSVLRTPQLWMSMSV
jgi:hypothetical protein